MIKLYCTYNNLWLFNLNIKKLFKKNKTKMSLKTFILDKLNNDKQSPIVIQTLDFFEATQACLNEHLSKYSKWQIVILSVLVTYLFMKFWYYYLDLEKG